MTRRRAVRKRRKRLSIEPLEPRRLLDVAGFWQELGFRSASGSGLSYDGQNMVNGDPAVALTPQGHTVVAYESYPSSGTQADSGLTVRLFDGQAWTPLFIDPDDEPSLNDPRNYVVPNTQGGRDPDVAVDDLGNIYLTWLVGGQEQTEVRLTKATFDPETEHWTWSGLAGSETGGGVSDDNHLDPEGVGVVNGAPAIAIGPDHLPVVAYAAYDITQNDMDVVAKKFINGEWVELTGGPDFAHGGGGVSNDAMASAGWPSAAQPVDIAIGGDNAPIVVWSSTVDSSHAAEIYGRRWNEITNTWDKIGADSAADPDEAPVGGISNDSDPTTPGAHNSLGPRIAIRQDPNDPGQDIVMVAWRDYEDLELISSGAVYLRQLNYNPSDPTSSSWDEVSTNSATGSGVTAGLTDGGRGYYDYVSLDIGSDGLPLIGLTHVEDPPLDLDIDTTPPWSESSSWYVGNWYSRAVEAYDNAGTTEWRWLGESPNHGVTFTQNTEIIELNDGSPLLVYGVDEEWPERWGWENTYLNEDWWGGPWDPGWLPLGSQDDEVFAHRWDVLDEEWVNYGEGSGEYGGLDNDIRWNSDPVVATNGDGDIIAAWAERILDEIFLRVSTYDEYLGGWVPYGDPGSLPVIDINTDEIINHTYRWDELVLGSDPGLATEATGRPVLAYLDYVNTDDASVMEKSTITVLAYNESTGAWERVANGTSGADKYAAVTDQSVWDGYLMDQIEIIAGPGDDTYLAWRNVVPTVNWVTFTSDLSAYGVSAGDTVQVRFNFDTEHDDRDNGNSDDNPEGWYIDDFRVADDQGDVWATSFDTPIGSNPAYFHVEDDAGAPGTNLWHTSDHRSLTGRWAAYYGRELDFNYNLGSWFDRDPWQTRGVRNAGNLLSPSIPLAGTTGPIILSFDYWLAAEAPEDGQPRLYDVATVEISVNGDPWQPVTDNMGTGPWNLVGSGGVGHPNTAHIQYLSEGGRHPYEGSGRSDINVSRWGGSQWSEMNPPRAPRPGLSGGLDFDPSLLLTPDMEVWLAYSSGWVHRPMGGGAPPEPSSVLTDIRVFEWGSGNWVDQTDYTSDSVMIRKQDGTRLFEQPNDTAVKTAYAHPQLALGIDQHPMIVYEEQTWDMQGMDELGLLSLSNGWTNRNPNSRTLNNGDPEWDISLPDPAEFEESTDVDTNNTFAMRDIFPPVATGMPAEADRLYHTAITGEIRPIHLYQDIDYYEVRHLAGVGDEVPVRVIIEITEIDYDDDEDLVIAPILTAYDEFGNTQGSWTMSGAPGELLKLELPGDYLPPDGSVYFSITSTGPPSPGDYHVPQRRSTYEIHVYNMVAPLTIYESDQPTGDFPPPGGWTPIGTGLTQIVGELQVTETNGRSKDMDVFSFSNLTPGGEYEVWRSGGTLTQEVLGEFNSGGNLLNYVIQGPITVTADGGGRAYVGITSVPDFDFNPSTPAPFGEDHQAGTYVLQIAPVEPTRFQETESNNTQATADQFSASTFVIGGGDTPTTYMNGNPDWYRLSGLEKNTLYTVTVDADLSIAAYDPISGAYQKGGSIGEFKVGSDSNGQLLIVVMAEGQLSDQIFYQLTVEPAEVDVESDADEYEEILHTEDDNDTFATRNPLGPATRLVLNGEIVGGIDRDYYEAYIYYWEPYGQRDTVPIDVELAPGTDLDPGFRVYDANGNLIGATSDNRIEVEAEVERNSFGNPTGRVILRIEVLPEHIWYPGDDTAYTLMIGQAYDAYVVEKGFQQLMSSEIRTAQLLESPVFGGDYWVDTGTISPEAGYAYILPQVVSNSGDQPIVTYTRLELDSAGFPVESGSHWELNWTGTWEHRGSLDQVNVGLRNYFEGGFGQEGYGESEGFWYSDLIASYFNPRILYGARHLDYEFGWWRTHGGVGTPFDLAMDGSHHYNDYRTPIPGDAIRNYIEGDPDPHAFGWRTDGHAVETSYIYVNQWTGFEWEQLNGQDPFGDDMPSAGGVGLNGMAQGLAWAPGFISSIALRGPGVPLLEAQPVVAWNHIEMNLIHLRQWAPADGMYQGFPQLEIVETSGTPDDNLLEYGQVAAGSDAYKVISFRNTGDEKLVVYDILFGGTDGWRVTDVNDQPLAYPFVVQPGDERLVRVHVAPTAAGLLHSTMYVASNDPMQEYDPNSMAAYQIHWYPLDLRGVAYNDSDIVVTENVGISEDATVTFGLVENGQTSAPQSVRIYNYGQSDLTVWLSIDGVSPGSDDSFALVGPTQRTVPGDSSEDVQIVFNGTLDNQGGAVGYLVVRHDDYGNDTSPTLPQDVYPYRVRLIGNMPSLEDRAEVAEGSTPAVSAYTAIYVTPTGGLDLLDMGSQQITSLVSSGAGRPRADGNITVYTAGSVLYAYDYTIDDSVQGVQKMVNLSEALMAMTGQFISASNPSIDGNRVVFAGPSPTGGAGHDIHVFDLNLVNGTLDFDNPIVQDSHVVIPDPNPGAPADDDRPDVSGDWVVWRRGSAAAGYSVWGYDLTAEQIFQLSIGNADGPRLPRASGEYAAWVENDGGNKIVLHERNVGAMTLFWQQNDVSDEVTFYGDLLVWADSRNGNFDLYGYYLPGTTEPSGVWGSGSDNVFTVGRDGTILRYHHENDVSSNRMVWTQMPSGTTEPLNGIWGLADDEVYTVGGTGTILRYNGLGWSPQTSGTTQALYGIWGAGTDDIFAVGEGGTILHYTASGWSSMASGVTETLRGVWGSGSNDVFAVGANGTILHYDGGSWSLMTSGTTKGLNGVWGTGAGDVYAVGDDGTILRYDSWWGSWSSMVSGTTQPLHAVWGTGPDEVFAVGNWGAALHYNGSNWAVTSSGTQRGLAGVWGTSGSDVYAVDSWGRVVNYDGARWSTVLEGSGVQDHQFQLTFGPNDEENPDVWGNAIAWRETQTGKVYISGVPYGVGQIEVPQEGASIDFGNVVVGVPRTYDIEIKNVGTGPLTIEGLVTSLTSGSANLSLVTSIPPDASGHIVIQQGTSLMAQLVLTATDVVGVPPELIEGTVEIHSSNSEGALNPITLNFQALADEPNMTVVTGGLDMGSITVGQTSVASFTVRNDASTAPLVINNVRSDDPSLSFQLLSGTTTLEPGEEAVYQVTWTPTTGGSLNATVEIHTNDPGASPYYALSATGYATGVPAIVVTESAGASNDDKIDFGARDQAPGTVSQQFTITNTGSDDLIISNWNLMGPGAAVFSLQSGGSSLPMSFTLAPNGGSITVDALFNTADRGVFTATLSLTTNDPDPHDATYTIALTGTVKTGLAIVTPDELDFGQVERDETSASHAFWIVNNGQAPLTVYGVTSTNAAFQVTAPTGYSGMFVLAAGQTTPAFMVTFSPTAAQTYQAAIQVSSDDPTSPILSEPTLTGEGIDVADLVVAGGVSADGTLRFQDTTVGTTRETTITLRNAGSGTLRLLSWSVDNSAYVIRGTAGPGPIELGPNGSPSDSVDFIVTFTPLSAINHPGTITIVSDNPNGGTLTIKVLGQGTPVPVAADFNGDGQVDGNDFALFQTAFTSGLYDSSMDLDHDGDLDFADLGIFLGYYGQQSKAPAKTQVASYVNSPDGEGSAVTGGISTDGNAKLAGMSTLAGTADQDADEAMLHENLSAALDTGALDEAIESQTGAVDPSAQIGVGDVSTPETGDVEAGSRAVVVQAVASGPATSLGGLTTPAAGQSTLGADVAAPVTDGLYLADLSTVDPLVVPYARALLGSSG